MEGKIWFKMIFGSCDCSSAVCGWIWPHCTEERCCTCFTWFVFFFYQGWGIFDSAPSELHFNPFLMLDNIVSIKAELPKLVNITYMFNIVPGVFFPLFIT